MNDKCKTLTRNFSSCIAAITLQAVKLFFSRYDDSLSSLLIKTLQTKVRQQLLPRDLQSRGVKPHNGLLWKWPSPPVCYNCKALWQGQRDPSNYHFNELRRFKQSLTMTVNRLTNRRAELFKTFVFRRNKHNHKFFIINLHCVGGRSSKKRPATVT